MVDQLSNKINNDNNEITADLEKKFPQVLK